MSTQNGPGVAALGSSVLLFALGIWLLFAAGAGVVYRGQIATEYAIHSHMVATASGLIGVFGLTAVLMAYRLTASKSRRQYTAD